MQANLPKLDLAISQQLRAVQTARIQLSAVEQSNYGSMGYGGTRAVIEGQIARAASGAPAGLTYQQATRNYYNTREQLMYSTQRSARWALAARHVLQDLAAGESSNKIPELYETNLMNTCPGLLK